MDVKEILIKDTLKDIKNIKKLLTTNIDDYINLYFYLRKYKNEKNDCYDHLIATAANNLQLIIDKLEDFYDI